MPSRFAGVLRAGGRYCLRAALIRRIRTVAAGSVTLVLLQGAAAHADESGASAWLPGQFASFAAVPGDPGFSFETIYYYRAANAQAGASFARGINVFAGYGTTEQYLYLTPSYTFAQPVINGQLSIGATFALAKVDSSVSGALSVPTFGTFTGSNNDSVTGAGDIYPIASLKWETGPHNFMVYGTASVPIGFYDPNRLAGIGLGHWSMDGGLGYTWLGSGGFEFSATGGVTYNFVNPSTQYQSGLDGHLDLGLSYSPSDAFYFGAVGYLYDQLTDDTGANARFGGFQSRVAGAGPQVGYAFAIGNVATELNLRGYKEFGAQNRPEGWNVWLTLSLSRARRKASE
jgi:hypothetical protein